MTHLPQSLPSQSAPKAATQPRNPHNKVPASSSLANSSALPVATLSFLLLTTSLFSAQASPKPKKPKPDTPSSLLDDYLKRARSMNQPAPETTGSLWVSNGSLAALAMDYRAMKVGDVVLIHLTDSFTAATTGENSQSRAFAATSGITGLVGAIGAKNRLQNLFGASSGNTLDGKGSSTLSSNVTVDLSAQVLEVLPNGVLVVQAARDISVGNDHQTILLRGLIRPGDIAPTDNSVTSSEVGELEVEIKGKGAVAEASRQPNIIIRTLLKLFSF
jgi:flagellar L-ring protein FlgH